MAQQLIGVGSAPNDTTGDPLRTAFGKCNDNFTELYGTRAPHCGRLEYVSATQIKFLPYNGDLLKINGALYQIPSGGVAGANTGVFVNGIVGQNLAAATTYLLSLFNNSGTLTLHFGTSLSHGRDTAVGNVGIEIVTGSSLHSVIGMVRTNASAQFQVDNTFVGLINWFNRRNVTIYGNSASGIVTSSSSAVELTTGARVYFLGWAEELAIVSVVGAFVAGSPGTGSIQIGYDGATIMQAVPNMTVGTTGWWGSSGGAITAGVTEGFHYFTPMGNAGGVSMTFYAHVSGIIRG
jgi:hypothetical protein